MMKSVNLERKDDYKMIPSSPFYINKNKKTNSVLLRFTVIFVLPILLLVTISLPINYIITGKWGYESKRMKWFSNWLKIYGF